MTEVTQQSRLRRLVTGPVVVATTTAVVLVLLVVPRSSLPSTTHAGASPVALVADTVAALALAAAGFFAWLRRGKDATAVAAAVAALAWAAHDLVGWEGGPSSARSIGTVVEPLFGPAVLHLGLATTPRLWGTRGGRLVVAGAYAAGAVVGLGRALVREPFLDPWCWSNCRDNALLLVARPDVAGVLWRTWSVLDVVVGVALVACAVVGGAALVRGRRASEVLASAGAAVLGTAVVVSGLLRLAGRLERPSDPVYAVLFQVQAWAATALAVAVVLVVVRSWRSRRRLHRLTAELADIAARGSLSQELATATGDRSLVLVYPTTNGGDTDGAGSTVAPPRDPRRVVTPIVRQGRELAHVHHDPGRVDAHQLRSELGPAALLALENERLQAELRARLSELQASRRRVVEAADAERTRLERDLHDGAQQRLLALAHELRALRVTASPDGEVATRIEEALQAVGSATTSLRELAHGIHPAVLTEAGLCAALESLADTADVPVVVDAPTDTRFGAAAERAAYVLVTAATEAASRSGAAELQVAVRPRDGGLVVDVGGGVELEPTGLTYVADRVGAVGGHVVRTPDGLQAELPVEVPAAHAGTEGTAARR